MDEFLEKYFIKEHGAALCIMWVFYVTLSWLMVEDIPTWLHNIIMCFDVIVLYLLAFVFCSCSRVIDRLRKRRGLNGNKDFRT